MSVVHNADRRPYREWKEEEGGFAMYKRTFTYASCLGRVVYAVSAFELDYEYSDDVKHKRVSAENIHQFTQESRGVEGGGAWGLLFAY